MNEWISADAEERPPELEDILICQRYGESGRLVQMVGRYIPAHTELASDDCDDWVDYNEETDEYYTPAGWYECQHNWGGVCVHRLLRRRGNTLEAFRSIAGG